MTQTLSPLPRQKFFDANGLPLAKGLLFTYQAGTVTKATTYTDSTGVTQNTNPIVLDARGECNLWIPPNTAYKYVLAPSTDTDPPSSPIWTVDNIVNSQLITLYGGTDTGSANAYILNFAANFTAYQDGIIIYFVAVNNNTGASTVNVNGLGVVSITTPSGGVLTAGQIIANQITAILYKGTGFVLLYSSAVLAAEFQPQNTSLVSGNYTLTLADQGYSIVMSVSSSRTLTIPPQSSVNFPLGTVINIVSEGGADLTIARGSGVLLIELGNISANSADSILPAGIRSAARLYKYSTDTWHLQRIIAPVMQNVQNAIYTFTYADAYRQVVHNDASSYNYLIPDNSVVPLTINSILTLVNNSSAAVILAPGGSVTLIQWSNNNAVGSISIPPYTIVRALKIGTNTWQLMDNVVPTILGPSSWQANLTGMTTTITGTMSYLKISNWIFLNVNTAINGTSNSTTFTINNVPAALQPGAARIATCLLTDNGIAIGGWASINGANITFGTGINNNATGFTGSGTKGLPAGFQLAYSL